jgi:YD repeat-containing protein
MPGVISGVTSCSFTFNADDLLSTETYDPSGNVLTSGGNIFTYDSESRLKSMNGRAVLLQYDGDRNRVAKTVNGVTTRYLVDNLPLPRRTVRLRSRTLLPPRQIQQNAQFYQSGERDCGFTSRQGLRLGVDLLGFPHLQEEHE